MQRRRRPRERVQPCGLLRLHPRAQSISVQMFLVESELSIIRSSIALSLSSAGWLAVPEGSAHSKLIHLTLSAEDRSDREQGISAQPPPARASDRHPAGRLSAMTCEEGGERARVRTVGTPGPLRPCSAGTARGGTGPWKGTLCVRCSHTWLVLGEGGWEGWAGFPEEACLGLGFKYEAAMRGLACPRLSEGEVSSFLARWGGV